MDGLIIDLLSIALRRRRRRLIGRGKARVTPVQTYAENAGIIETKSTNIEHNKLAADARALAPCTTHAFVTFIGFEQAQVFAQASNLF